MKRSFVLGVLGLVAATASSFGAGFIYLDNYLSFGGNGGPPISYGIGVPANGVSGPLGTPGTGLLAGWTAGIYYANGNVLSQVQADPSGTAIPSSLYSGFILGTGPGSTALVYTSTGIPGTPGEFTSATELNVGGNAGDLITAEVVVYDTASGSYANATWRAHSAPFVMPTVAATDPSPNSVGNYMPAFSVGVPEPTTLTLTVLGGLASLVVLRRK
jgi:hypothetical protein